jgi:AmpD protein
VIALLGDAIEADGLLPGACYVRSPNQDARPSGEAIRLIVVHAISLPPGEFGGDGIERLFTNRLDAVAHPYYRAIQTLRVSAHFLIRRDGEVLQFVPCDRRAWHAGASCWRGREGCNDYSIGIELEGCGELPFSDFQYARLGQLVRVLGRTYGIEDIAGHADIAPGRKTDPGPNFDWRRLHASLVD